MDPQQGDQPVSTNPSETIATSLPERPRPDRQMVPRQFTAIYLEVVGGPMDGISARVDKDTLTIGRSPSADLSLRLDPLVSTNHARVVRDGNVFWLEDLDSRNGTFIGEQRVQERTPIGPGTLFVLGSTCLDFTPL